MIELEQARGLLARAVLTKGPDFVYKRVPDFGSCYYAPMTGKENDFQVDDPRNETGCLVGVALDLAGVTRHHGVMGNVRGLAEYLGEDFMSNEAISYFQIAQNYQDRGRSWGAAYQAAENSLPSWIESNS